MRIGTYSIYLFNEQKCFNLVFVLYFIFVFVNNNTRERVLHSDVIAT